MLRYLVLAFFAAASASDVIFYGPCPDVKPVEDFNFAAYAGTWYELARYPNAGEEDVRGQCTTAEYTVNGNKGKVKNTHVIDGVKSYIKGDLTLVGPAKVMLTYTFGGKSKRSYLSVLSTDYKSYSIGYSCKYFPQSNTHQIFSWIMSRSKVLSPEADATVGNFFKNTHILDPSKYIQNDQSDAACKASASREIQEFID